MPTPCTDGDWTRCHGPFRVSVAVARPAGYTEQWMVPTAEDDTLAPVSEVTLAVQRGLAALPADVLAQITDRDDNDRVRGGQLVTARLGAELVYRGAPGIHPIDDDDTWTVQTLVWVPDPAVALPLVDHALLAWLWVEQLTEIDLPSARPARVSVTGVSTVSERPLPLLCPDFATAGGAGPGPGRTRRITLAGDHAARVALGL